jgi:hypothetical protein
MKKKRTMKEFTTSTAIELIGHYGVANHSPYYSRPCSDACPVCNMDTELYDMARLKKETNEDAEAERMADFEKRLAILTTDVAMIKACHDQGSVGLDADEERLDWVIFNSAIICHSNDGEHCWIKYYEDERTLETIDLFDDPRKAIDAAMLGRVVER